MNDHEQPRTPSHREPLAARDLRSVCVLVADEQPLDRRGLVTLLETQPDIQVVGEAGSTVEAVERCRALWPAVAVMDSAMPDLERTSAIAAVQIASPETRVLAVADRGEGDCPLLGGSGPADPREVWDTRPCELGADCLHLAALRGAMGAIRRSAQPEELFDAVRALARGNAWFESGTAGRLIQRALTLARAVAEQPMTERDLEVAALIVDGHSNKEIARILGVGVPTVKRHVGRMLAKLGLQDRLQLGLYLLRHPRVLQTRMSRSPQASSAPKGAR
ncbi:MAG: hypothetical protein A2W00_02765 [Candidatus Eisenbacteria bacterium RBG_16_71_46]|nr:MAG: hypothetical protein A2W00_02765 [Candidatus Eisenbacteria bacterium RBG_16_71_46]OGF21752.1 MAG: hypothetical protein A2V63_05060 [Candidatus Eisenbacteria bacterium RBG_19FT_COMBO_70_11]